MRAPILVVLLTGCQTGFVNQGGGGDGDGDGSDAAPSLRLSGAALDFGEIAYDTTETRLLAVSNTGGATLTVSDVAVDAPFAVSPGNLEVDAGAVAQLSITVRLADYEDHTATLTLESDDPATPHAEVTVHALVDGDADGDGHARPDAGGDDCDDARADVHPGADEQWYDEIDEDCSGGSDFDQDGDGYDAETDDHHPDEPDCNDVMADYYPGAPDEPYDNRDTDCAGDDDFDVDGDGSRSDAYGAGTDCDDADPAVNEDATETFDGVDDDCDGEVDDDVPVTTATWRYEADGKYDAAGSTLLVGDVDGDGVADLVVGAPGAGAAVPDAPGRGGVAVFLGGALKSTGTAIDKADAWVQGASAQDEVGTGLAWIGDWDGDDDADVAVGAPGATTTNGRVYVVDAAELAACASLGLAGTSVDGGLASRLGTGLYGRADLDGDGLGDLLSVYGVSPNGLALVYGGAVGALDIEDADARWDTGGAGLAARALPGGAGDYDGDGYDDVVYGDDTLDASGWADAGQVWVLYGGDARYATGDATALDGTWSLLAAGDAEGARVGAAAALLPDADGDGDAELWIFAADDALYRVDGGARGGVDPREDADVRYTWGSTSGNATGITSAGDWDRDGVADVLVALADTGSGKIDLFPGVVPDRDSTEQDGRIGYLAGASADDNETAGAGLSASAGDLTGDGGDELVLADPAFSAGAGEVYVLSR